MYPYVLVWLSSDTFYPSSVDDAVFPWELVMYIQILEFQSPHLAKGSRPSLPSLLLQKLLWW